MADSSQSGWPWWLQQTRCANTTAASPKGCEFYLQTVRKCNSATEGGRRYRHCKEVYQRFRACHGRQPEEVGYQVVETREPEDMPMEGMPLGTTGGDAMPLDSAQGATPSGRVVSAEAGQLLDEFFAFANELRESLVRSGSMQQELQPTRHSSSKQQSSSLLGRLFGRGTASDNKSGIDAQSGGHTHSLSSCQILSQYALPRQDV